MNKLSFFVVTAFITLIAGCGDDPRLVTFGEEISKLKGQNEQEKAALTKVQEENQQTKAALTKVEQENQQAKALQEKLQKENNETKEALQKVKKELDISVKTSPLIRQPVEEKDFDALLSTSTATVQNQPKNVIFFFIDSLRNDHVNMTTAPAMKQFIDDSWSFDHPYSSSTITHKSTFSMFYSQPAFLRQPFIAIDWKKGSPFLRSMKKFGYNIKLFGSPWQYCRDNVAQKENSASRTGGVSNLRLLYGEKPRDLLSQCYKFYDFDDNQYLVNNRRNPEDFPQAFPDIGIKAKSWEKYQGDLVPNPSGTEYRYPHQGYLDYKIISDAIDDIQNDNLPGNTSKNFYFVYLFGVHYSQAWPDKGIPNSVVAPTSYSITPDFAPFYARLRHVPTIANGDIGAVLPSLHTPVFWEISSLVKKALTDNWGISDPKYANLRNELRDVYHNSVVGADYEFNRLLSSLTPAQLDDSLIVLVSDHGYLLFDKGVHPVLNQDQSAIYNHFGPAVKENTNVPIAIKFPKSADPKISSAKKKTIGSHVDIFPTLIDYISPNFYAELKDNNFIAGSSLLSHERTCATTVFPTGTFVDNTVIFNNGNFKAWITMQSYPGALDFKDYQVNAYLDMDDNEITYPQVGGVLARQHSHDNNLSIIAKEFAECLQEVFPKTDVAEAGKKQAKYDMRLNLNEVLKQLQSKTFADKLDFLKIFKGEDVQSIIYANYHTLPPAERNTMINYVNSLQFTLGTPANPNNPLLDFETVPAIDLPNLAICGGSETAGRSSDTDPLGQRKAINSVHKNILIKPGEQHFYYNDTYFDNNNYTNLPRVYFDKLKKTERFHGFAFVGNRGGKNILESQNSHAGIDAWGRPIGALSNGLSAGSGNNIDLYRYFLGAESGTLAGFRSFSRSTLVAKNFAGQYQKASDPTVSEGGYVYAVYIEGGFNITGVKPISSDANNPSTPIQSLYNEQEVAVRGYTHPRNIVAFRKVHMGSNKFDNTTQVFVRKGFKTMDPAAYEKVVKALSGCSNYSN